MPSSNGTPDSMDVFDSHFHIIDTRFPLVANNGYLPENFSCADYLERMRGYRLAGGAVVSGSFQAFDQSYLLDALQTLGPLFAGVTQLPATVSDLELLDLDRGGVRALRFNLKRGGSEKVAHLDAMARRVHEVVGWHVELYVDSTELAGLYGTLASLPAVSIDHLGLSKEGFGTLLKLAEKGVRVKATGFGRVDFDVKTALRELYAANPDALMFGSDLPSTRAPRPYRDEDYAVVIEALGMLGQRKFSAATRSRFTGCGRNSMTTGRRCSDSSPSFESCPCCVYNEDMHASQSQAMKLEVHYEINNDAGCCKYSFFGSVRVCRGAAGEYGDSHQCPGSLQDHHHPGADYFQGGDL